MTELLDSAFLYATRSARTIAYKTLHPIIRICWRYGKTMNRILVLILSLFSNSALSGSLYSFDNNVVIINALNHIHSRYSSLAKVELVPLPLRSSINRTGQLEVTTFFSYKADNEFGLLYTCVKVDENGTLLNLGRDILARKGIGNFPLPSKSGCWGKP